MAVCPHCHTSYGWDGHHCLHCQGMSVMNTIGTTTNAAAGVLWLADELAPLAHDPTIQESVTELLGDSLATLGETLGEHLGDMVGGI